MKQKKIVLLINISVLTFLFLATGCDFSKQPPNPPHAEAALIIELLSALKNKDYELAEKKLKRLKAFESNEIYLESIQVRVKNNKLISEAQMLLNSGDIDKAIESLNKSINIAGQNSSLADALTQLKTLKNIRQLTDDILKGENSREIATSSGKLNKMISSYPSAKTLSNKSVIHA